MVIVYFITAVAIILAAVYWYSKSRNQLSLQKQIELEKQRRRVWLEKSKEFETLEPKGPDAQALKELRLSQITNEEIMKKASSASKGSFNPLDGDVTSKRYSRPVKTKRS